MPAGPTYNLIESKVLGSNTASVNFTSFGGYTDLVLIINGTASTEATDQMRFNGDTGANYAYCELTGNGASGRAANQTRCLLGNTWTGRYTKEIVMYNYSNTNMRKTVSSRSGYTAGTYANSLWANLWNNTAAITSFGVGPDTGTMTAGTTLTLYGILAA